MTEAVCTNLTVLRPSRKAPRSGDLFVLQPDDQFLYGRVIRTDAMAGPSIRGAILLYIYALRSATPTEPERSAVSRDDLLLPPLMTNRLPWSRGYFETIANWPLEAGEVHDPHCFRDRIRGTYHDDQANELPEPVEPVGPYGLQSFRTIDDRVSDALGLSRA